MNPRVNLRFDIEIRQSPQLTRNSGGICMRGCSELAEQRQKRSEDVSACDDYRDAAVEVGRQVVPDAKVSDIALKNAESTCRFDIEATGETEVS